MTGGRGKRMTIVEYKTKVIDLFKNGSPTETQWQEMANAVLHVSENHGSIPNIDSAIDPELVR